MSSSSRSTRRPRSGAADRSSSMTPARDADSERSQFHRLAAQLGLSRQLQRIDESLSAGAQRADASSPSPPAPLRRLPASHNHSHSHSVEAGAGGSAVADLSLRLVGRSDDEDDGDAEARVGQHIEEEGDEDQDEDEDEDEDVEHDDSLAPLTPLRSDHSASESLSSELSLPRSFGQYDRRPSSRFDDHLQQRRRVGSDSSSHELMRKFYEAQVEKVRSQLSAATQAQRESEHALQTERAQWQQRESSLEATAAAVRSDVAKLERENQQLRERLELERMHLADLEISDGLAEQLARQPERERSVKESVQLQVHRLLRGLQRELDAARQETAALQQLCESYERRAATSSDDAAQRVRALEANERRLQLDLELSEATRSELEQQIATLVAQVESLQLREKTLEQERAALRPAQALQEELESLKTENDRLRERCLAAEEASESVNQERDELQQRVKLLEADKTFLVDVKRQLEEQEARLLSKQKELQSRLDLSQASHASETREMHRVHDEARLQFEKQLETELQRFLEMSKREIETIRSSSQMTYERENRLLREARDDALKQIDSLQSRLQAVQTTLEENTLELTRRENAHTTTVATLRNDLKMKHFELSQLGASLDERMTELLSAKRQVELLEQKIRVHQEEFARLETTSTTRISQLEAELELERNKLKQYEQLEVDLDDAVLQTGALSAAETSADGQPALQDVMATFAAIPTSSKRRFQQSVLLAQRVVKHQKEAMEWQRQVAMVTQEKTHLEREVAELRHRLANLHQPQAYLIDKLSRKDQEIQTLRQQQTQLETQLQELRGELRETTLARISLQGQLQHVLARREELETLKSSVLALKKRVQVPVSSPEKDSEPAAALASGLELLKHPPSPAVLSQMMRPPTASSDQARAAASSSAVDKAMHSPIAEISSSQPKWYIKLRS
ncbi:hypothetical protein ATCC90586_007641 [Pythium insidiosum]|nr:hypothetical protein ATCC90586_007641 [Pythium insidiosum]